MIPTIAQMARRALAGHRLALAAVNAGKTWPPVGATAAELRGARIVLSTLRRWACTDATGITMRGLALLRVLETSAQEYRR